MDTATTRLLRLLVLLSARAAWTAPELAERLEVTERTVRRDMNRLRTLGYPVEGTSGPYGGYALGAGGHLPPLVLDDDEAVAVAMGLRAAAAGGAPGSSRPRSRRSRSSTGSSRWRCASRSPRCARSPWASAGPSFPRSTSMCS